jgi:fused signal recognition particle receptor
MHRCNSTRLHTIVQASNLGTTGIILAKLDGTAKGGIVVAITRELGLPIQFVGIGEKLEDLLPFNPREFVESLFET